MKARGGRRVGDSPERGPLAGLAIGFALVFALMFVTEQRMQPLHHGQLGARRRRRLHALVRHQLVDQVQQPLAIAIIAGLVAQLPLVLLVLPVLLRILFVKKDGSATA